MTTQEIATIGHEVYDHYLKYLGGAPSRSEAFRCPAFSSSIQILTFSNVFAGCTTMTTLGYGRLSFPLNGEFTEIVLSSTVATADLDALIARSLFAAADSAINIEDGISLGGLDAMAPIYTEKTGKSALFFKKPFPFPHAFEHFGSRLRGRILLAVPIARAEHEMLKRDGSEALEDLFERSDIDPFDVTRRSLV